ncbi:Hypothetical predicted protein [Lecanosticta acicola]|uniref:Uncharacterized protein n=1 Tax=Lecanosticta acicola TaxID=111012 RepID=A0AAI8Z2S4_9PEZI|nr:Hypothetical predicted protein [Lecanosticta acicola]
MQLKRSLILIFAASVAAMVIPRHDLDSETPHHLSNAHVEEKRDPEYDLKQLVLPVEVTKAEEEKVQEKRDPAYDLKQLVLPVEVTKVEEEKVQEKRDPAYDLKQLVLPVEVTKVEEKAEQEKRDPSYHAQD